MQPHWAALLQGAAMLLPLRLGKHQCLVTCLMVFAGRLIMEWHLVRRIA